MSRAELAEAVNDHLWRTTGKRHALDAHAIARYERGKVGWPSAPYRAGLKAVLGADCEIELEFQPTWRGRNRKTPASETATVGTAEHLPTDSASLVSFSQDGARPRRPAAPSQTTGFGLGDGSSSFADFTPGAF